MFKYIILLIIIVFVLYLIKETQNKVNSIKYFNPDSISDRNTIIDILKHYVNFIKPFESKIKLSTEKILDNHDLIEEYYKKICDEMFVST